MPTDALDVAPSEQSVLHLAFNQISHRLHQSFGATLLIFGITKSNFILKLNSTENKHDALIAVQREGKGASEPFYSEMDMATARHFPFGVGILP